MDQNQTIVQTLFASYSDDQKSMLLEIIQKANGSHEADVVYGGGLINAYSSGGEHFYRNADPEEGIPGLTEDQVEALHRQVMSDLVTNGYDFHLAKPKHETGHHKKHG